MLPNNHASLSTDLEQDAVPRNPLVQAALLTRITISGLKMRDVDAGQSLEPTS